MMSAERGAGRKEIPSGREGGAAEECPAADAEEPPGYPAAASSYREAVI